MRRQDRTCQTRAEHGQTSLLTSHLFTCTFLVCYPSGFPRFFFPKPALSLPFPVCSSSPKHPMISFAQSPNALPLQRIMCPALAGSDSPQSVTCYRDTLPTCRQHFLSVYNVEKKIPNMKQNAGVVTHPSSTSNALALFKNCL